MKRAVFLDRDGTLIEELGYLTPSSALRVFPWTVDAIRLLNRAGVTVVVVTNQGGIARGLYSVEFVERTHQMLHERFRAAGARIDAWQYCPHHPEGLLPQLRVPCRCRKPASGMLEAAIEKLGPIDLRRSWVIGDHWRDVQMGHLVGATGVLVRTGHGRDQEAAWPMDIAPPALVCDNLIAAIGRILS